MLGQWGGTPNSSESSKSLVLCVRWPSEEDRHLRKETDAFGGRILPELKLEGFGGLEEMDKSGEVVAFGL